MAIQKPVNLVLGNGNQAFDVTQPTQVSWTVTGSVQTSFAINFYNNNTNQLIYQVQASSYATSYLLPADFVSLLPIKFIVQVWAADGSSAISDSSPVYLASVPPVVTVNTPNVAAPSYVFSATYSQATNIPLSNWQAFLYDANQNLIQQSGIQTSPTLSWMFTGLQNSQFYYIQFQATSAVGLTANSAMVQFEPIYATPMLNSILTAQNVYPAAVQLTWDILIITGAVTGTAIYVNNRTALDVRNGTVYFGGTSNSGLYVFQEGTYKFFIISPASRQDLIVIQGANGSYHLQYHYEDGIFYLYKYVNGLTIPIIYQSNPVFGSSFFLGVQIVDSLNIEMYAETIY